LNYAGAVERAWSYIVSIAVLGAMLWPVVFWDGYEDSFPVSSYPMFSNPRETAEMSLKYALGIGAGGERSWIEPGLVANGEVLQARATISRSVKAGKASAKKLCTAIAARVASREVLPGVEEIRLVTGTYDAVEYLTGRDRVGEEKVHATCPVPGRGTPAP
jgi:hypothetical protein